MAQRLGFKRDEALTIGKAVAGQTAHKKGTRLGIFEPTPKAIKESRAINADKPIKPESVEKYFQSRFGESLGDVTEAMKSLAKSRPPQQLASDAFKMYMQFRPEVSAGKKGWGANGTLSLSLIHEMANFPR